VSAVLARTLERQEGSWHYLDAHFEPWSQEGERRQLMAVYPVFCATFSEVSDDARLRRLALDVFRIFELQPTAEHAWADEHGMARLDGLDLERRIGFELRGRGTPEECFEQTPEDEAEALDDAELVGGLLFDREASWPVTVLPTDGMRVTQGNTGPVLSVERAVKVILACQGTSDYGPQRQRSSGLPTGAPLSELGTTTRGAPSVLVFKASAQPLVAARPAPRPEFRVRVRQWFGTTELVHETPSFTCLLPSSFDLARPFERELELAPGYYSFYGGGARIGAAARAK
jgi:hypothetical protein